MYVLAGVYILFFKRNKMFNICALFITQTVLYCKLLLNTIKSTQLPLYFEFYRPKPDLFPE